jgi:hypothetical protein
VQIGTQIPPRSLKSEIRRMRIGSLIRPIAMRRMLPIPWSLGSSLVLPCPSRQEICVGEGSSRGAGYREGGRRSNLRALAPQGVCAKHRWLYCRPRATFPVLGGASSGPLVISRGHAVIERCIGSHHTDPCRSETTASTLARMWCGRPRIFRFPALSATLPNW